MTPPRYTRIIGYLMMAAGGATAFAIPAPSIQAATGWVVYLWAAFLLAGGSLCAYGALTDRWIGEYTGLPLISSAFGVYAVVLVLSFYLLWLFGRMDDTAPGAILSAVVVLGFPCAIGAAASRLIL